VDSGLARALAARGTPVSITIAAVCALAAVTVAAGRLDRIGVAAAALAGAVIWVAEDFGGIFTGQGTDPNSGLLLIVLAAAFWPVRWRAAVRHPKGDLTYRRTALHR
jgi:drug/metabolite transporter (DMT)-like permease